MQRIARPLLAPFVLAAIVFSSTVSAWGYLGTVSHVIDGDTFTLTDSTRIRIIGIDALESHKPSTEHLRALIEGKDVELTSEGDAKDKYGRTLAYVDIPGIGDVGARMVQDGYAIVYVKYPCSRQQKYLELELAARRDGRGIWAGHLQSDNASFPPDADSPLRQLFPPDAKTAGDAVSSATVYVTATGTKYHRDGCRYLSKSRIAMPLAEATIRCGPCSVCKPPVVTSETKKVPPEVALPSGDSSRQCSAITMKGTRCKRTAAAGSAFCWQHGK